MVTKSARNGKSFEYEVRDLLREATGITSFERTPQSGAWVGKSNAKRVETASEEMVNVMSGDIVVPDGWRWNIECKNYEGVSVHQLYFGEECKQIDEFLEQASNDANVTGKEPLLIFKVKKKPYDFKKKLKEELKEANIKVPQINSITQGILVAEKVPHCSEIKANNHIQYSRRLENGTHEMWRFFDFETWLKFVKSRQFSD